MKYMGNFWENAWEWISSIFILLIIIFVIYLLGVFTSGEKNEDDKLDPALYEEEYNNYLKYGDRPDETGMGL